MLQQQKLNPAYNNTTAGGENSDSCSAPSSESETRSSKDKSDSDRESIMLDSQDERMNDFDASLFHKNEKVKSKYKKFVIKGHMMIEKTKFH